MTSAKAAKQEKSKGSGREAPAEEGGPRETAELGFGFLGLEGLLGGIERIIKLAETAEKAGGELKREGELRGPEGLRGVYGFRVRTALGGRRRPDIETFGNLRREKEKLKVSDTREPLVDVFDEPEAVVVVAELPGVPEGQITATLSGRTLTLQAGEGERKYQKELTLPAEVLEARRTLEYRNGILKLVYPKRQPSAAKKK